MKIIITGSSGMVGRATVLEAIEDKRISEILLINRKHIEFENSRKVKEIIIDSFDKISNLKDELNAYDLCVHCIGMSESGADEKNYRYVTYEVAKMVADTLYGVNKNMVFCYVSAAGTYDTDKDGAMWARVKGEAERYILGKGFRDAYAFRPGGILPEKGVKSQVKLYNTIYKVVRPINPILRLFKSITTSSNLGRALINVLFYTQSEKRVNGRMINEIAKM